MGEGESPLIKTVLTNVVCSVALEFSSALKVARRPLAGVQKLQAATFGCQAEH